MTGLASPQSPARRVLGARDRLRRRPAAQLPDTAAGQRRTQCARSSSAPATSASSSPARCPASRVRHRLVGFVDAQPLESRRETRRRRVLGSSSDLPGDRRRARRRAGDRRVLARAGQPRRSSVVRSLRDLDVQRRHRPAAVRVVGPHVELHSVEGLPLVGVPPARLSRSSRVMKRGVDIVGAASCCSSSPAPLFAFVASRIKLRLAGPGLLPADAARAGHAASSRPQVPHDARRHRREEHREYIERSMTLDARP